MTGNLSLGTISQLSRTVRNIQEAQRWYGEVLGLKHLYSIGSLAFLDCGGIRLFLSEGEDATGAESIIYPSTLGRHGRVDGCVQGQRRQASGDSFPGAPRRKSLGRYLGFGSAATLLAAS